MTPIILVGLGGTGSHLCEPLARYLATLAKPPEVVLVDGDTYSEGNRDRQRTGPVETGINKATAQARRLLTLLPQLRVRSVDLFVSERNIGEIMVEGSLVICCPDNHSTRRTISQRCQRLRNSAAVIVGNELSDGAVQVYIRRAGRDVTPRPESYHPEMASPRDRSPAEMSCEELAARPAGGQIIFANVMAAAVALNAVYAILEGRIPEYHEVYFDVIKNVSVARTRERRCLEWPTRR